EGVEEVRRRMAALTQRSEALARKALLRLPAGEHRAVESLDDGSVLNASIVIENGSCTLDFSGTSPVHPENLNATAAIVRRAVLYLIRLLIDEPIPLNEGLLRPVELLIP